MKKLITVLAWAGLLTFIYPLVYHFNHDYLTGMQMLKLFWPWYLVQCVSSIILRIVYD